jgi:hypothetical protein
MCLCQFLQPSADHVSLSVYFSPFSEHVLVNFLQPSAEHLVSLSISPLEIHHVGVSFSPLADHHVLSALQPYAEHRVSVTFLQPSAEHHVSLSVSITLCTIPCVFCQFPSVSLHKTMCLGGFLQSLCRVTVGGPLYVT